MHVAFEVDNRSTDRTTGLFFRGHGLAVNNIFEANLTSDFRHNRNRVRVPSTNDLASFDFIAFADFQRRTLRNLVRLKLTTPNIQNRDLTISVQHDGIAFIVGHVTHASDANRSSLLDGFLVIFGNRVGNTTNVERTHGQLSTRFTDRLSRDDSNRHAFFDHVTGRHIHSVAAATNSQRRFARHWATNLDLFKAHFFDLGCNVRIDHLVLANHDFVGHRIHNVLTRDTTIDRRRQANLDLLTSINNTFGDTASRTAVFHRDHNVLCHIGQLTRQVTRVSCLERGIRQTFTSTVCRREVLQHRQAFTEVRLDWRLDNFTRRLGHQATHSSQLPNLFDTTTSTRVRHQEHRIDVTHATAIIGTHRRHHLFGDLLTSMRPSIEHLVVTLLFGNDSTLVVLAEFQNFFFRSSNNFLLGIRSHQVVGRERQTTACTLAEAQLVHVIKQINRLTTAQQLVTVRNHGRQIATLLGIVVEVHSLRQHHVEQDATVGCFDDRIRLTLFVVQANLASLWQTNFDLRMELDYSLSECMIGFFQRGEDHSFTLLIRQHQCDVVATHHRVLRRTHNWPAI